MADAGVADLKKAARDGMVPGALTRIMRAAGARGNHGTDTLTSCIVAQCTVVRWGEVARKRWQAEQLEGLGMCLRGAGGSRRAGKTAECEACGEPVTRLFKVWPQATGKWEGLVRRVAAREKEAAASSTGHVAR